MPVTIPVTSVTCLPAYGDIRVLPWMSWTRTDSACAGVVRTIVDAAEHAAATVSAARRADDLLGNGIPSGDVTGRRDEGGARTVCRYLWGGRCDARRGLRTGHVVGQAR